MLLSLTRAKVFSISYPVTIGESVFDIQSPCQIIESTNVVLSLDNIVMIVSPTGEFIWGEIFRAPRCWKFGAELHIVDYSDFLDKIVIVNIANPVDRCIRYAHYSDLININGKIFYMNLSAGKFYVRNNETGDVIGEIFLNTHGFVPVVVKNLNGVTLYTPHDRIDCILKDGKLSTIVGKYKRFSPTSSVAVRTLSHYHFGDLFLDDDRVFAAELHRQTFEFLPNAFKQLATETCLMLHFLPQEIVGLILREIFAISVVEGIYDPQPRFRTACFHEFVYFCPRKIELMKPKNNLPKMIIAIDETFHSEILASRFPKIIDEPVPFLKAELDLVVQIIIVESCEFAKIDWQFFTGDLFRCYQLVKYFGLKYQKNLLALIAKNIVPNEIVFDIALTLFDSPDLGKVCLEWVRHANMCNIIDPRVFDHGNSWKCANVEWYLKCGGKWNERFYYHIGRFKGRCALAKIGPLHVRNIYKILGEWYSKNRSAKKITPRKIKYKFEILQDKKVIPNLTDCQITWIMNGRWGEIEPSYI